MKKLLYSLFAGITLMGISCSEDIDLNDTPGNIPGMGNTPGQIEVLGTFSLPDGVAIDGEIKGSLSDISLQASILKSTSSDDGESDGDHHDGGDSENHSGGGCGDDGCTHQGGQGGTCEHGSGGQWVALNLTFVNLTDLIKEIVLPAGLVFECDQEGYQNGILIQEVAIKIMGRGAVNIRLNLYCVNEGKLGSDETLTYQLRGIASSKHIGHLTTRLSGKKIDTIHFSEDEREEYDAMRSKLQTLIWSITNHSGIDEAGWTYIDSLADLIN
nr:hypothetical protein [uncultured Carboxylicivirga sp.]